MDRPSPSLSSATGASLVGTLVAVGMLLIMITVGLTLMASTESSDVAAAELMAEPLQSLPCPAEVRLEAEIPSERACMSLVVRNVGEADGLARCELTGQLAGTEARFDANDVHVYTSEIGSGDTQELLVRIDGRGGDGEQLAGACDLVAPPQA